METRCGFFAFGTVSKPARRMRLPSRTPAGMLTRSFLTVRTAPLPWHVAHGSSMIVPEPPQREHGWEIENMPCP